MQYGHFREDGKEYIIDNVATPTPWINYIYNGRYFSTISNNGGGISYYKNPLHGRITRYRINDVLSDRPGKYVYIKDKETQEIWSLTWQPVGRDRESYRLAHGFGYTRVDALVKEIASSLLYFVPIEDDQEIWKIILTNKSTKTRKLSIYGYVEFALGHALVDLINQCDDQHFNRVYFDKKLNSLFATKTYWVTESRGTQQQENKEWDQWVFFTANLPVTHYETMRERFLGPFRTENNPIAIENDAFSSQDTDFGNAVGALQIDIELEPGQSKDIIFSLGVIPKTEFQERKKAAVAKYHSITPVNQAISAIEKNWENIFKKIVIETPDSNANLFMNYWSPYQAIVAFDVGRVASYYYWGISRGFGFRDTAQDVIAITISNSAKARERVLLLARQMFSDGHVYHHFYAEGKGETTKHCDDPVWFILAVTEYLKETGDFAILNQAEPFLDGKSGTILEHLYAVVNFIEHNLGAHDLPIFGRGDWNDTLDYIGGDDGGESVWGGMFYVTMLNTLVELLSYLKIDEKINPIQKLSEKIRQSIDTHCWDGEWYIRAYGAKNRKIGSKANEAGKIFLNTQSWAVLGQISEKERLIQALDSVRKHLDTTYGPKKCAPAFREIDTTIGLVTRCVAGKKENGAIFCHPASWLIQAECLMGRGKQAYTYYQKLLPNVVDSDIFKVEPYVYSQYITSDEHSSPGRASHSWQTGSAAWMFRIAIDYILGVRPTYTGLLVDPAIPSTWPKFRIERIFRGTRYIISVENPKQVEYGIESVLVDGQKIEGNIIPISKNEVCQVQVTMG
ncbi:glycosyl transferase family 36 [candidate division KSB1 bacterium]|nr:glycosyl transferase family 36 [candidate division KSB1 bacterium]